MSFTKRTTLTDTYVALTSADATGLAQLQGSGRARLHLGQSEPDDSSVDYVTLWDDGLPEFPFLNAETGDILYGRSEDGETVDLVVTATGTAPS